jgi:anti-anti-sigma regulatory factor
LTSQSSATSPAPTQKKLVDSGGGLTLINLSPHIREIFQIAGFDNIFEIA